jgi:2-methylcitrate dehydratase PrpD
MNGISDLAAFVAGLTPAGIAPPVRDKLRLHVADILGAWVAASATAEGRALIAFRRDLKVMAGTGAGPFDDLIVNVALARLSEVDDIHLASMVTPGSIVVPAAITLAATLPGAEAGDIAPAMLAGYEAMIRLGLAIHGPDVLYRGIWPTYFGAAFGTAAVAARLLRFDQEQTAHALAHAFTMGAPSVGHHHAVTTSRWLSVGNAARNGLTAALAARAGFTSDVDVLQSGLLKNVYGIDADLAPLAVAKASAPKLLEVSFKPWCAARQTMAATQALREILADDLSPDDIDRIEAFVLPPHMKMIDHDVRADDRASRLTSLPYQMAVAAWQPATALDVSQAVADVNTLSAFMARVTVSPDEALLADYPAVWPARVLAHTRSGRHERRVNDAPGDPVRPMTEKEIEDKFFKLTEPVLGVKSAQDLFQDALTLFSAPDVLSSVPTWLERIGTADQALQGKAS